MPRRKLSLRRQMRQPVRKRLVAVLCQRSMSMSGLLPSAPRYEPWLAEIPGRRAIRPCATLGLVSSCSPRRMRFRSLRGRRWRRKRWIKSRLERRRSRHSRWCQRLWRDVWAWCPFYQSRRRMGKASGGKGEWQGVGWELWRWCGKS